MWCQKNIVKMLNLSHKKLYIFIIIIIIIIIIIFFFFFTFQRSVLKIEKEHEIWSNRFELSFSLSNVGGTAWNPIEVTHTHWFRSCIFVDWDIFRDDGFKEWIEKSSSRSYLYCHLTTTITTTKQNHTHLHISYKQGQIAMAKPELKLRSANSR